MPDELCFLPIAEAARQIAARALSPVALTEAYLARISAVDAQLNAYVTMTADLALQQAKAAEAELQRGLNCGPLHGIPFGLKDMVETAGILTTAHSRLLAHNYPAKDAAVVERLRDAGAVLLGKHASHEFAHGGPSFDLPWPPARNPWNTAHYTNGSSSGSAAAVAGGLAAMAIGTDTGGSIRSPSFLCGTVGLKPTFGLVSRSGVIPFSMSCDHVGPITRSVEDCAIVLQAIAGHDPRDPGSARRELPDFAASLRAGIKGLRIGIVRHLWEEDAPANATLRMAVDAAIDVLRDLGAIVEDVRLRSLRHYYAVRIVLTESELFARHQHSLQQNAGAYGEHFLSRILAATLFTSADYIAAQRERRSIIEDMQPVYARYRCAADRRCRTSAAVGCAPQPGRPRQMVQPGRRSAVQRDGCAGARAALRVQRRWLAAWHADRGKAVRGRDRAAHRPRLRAGHTLGRSQTCADRRCGTAGDPHRCRACKSGRCHG